MAVPSGIASLSALPPLLLPPLLASLPGLPPSRPGSPLQAGLSQAGPYSGSCPPRLWAPGSVASAGSPIQIPYRFHLTCWSSSRHAPPALLHLGRFASMQVFFFLPDSGMCVLQPCFNQALAPCRFALQVHLLQSPE